MSDPFLPIDKLADQLRKIPASDEIDIIVYDSGVKFIIIRICGIFEQEIKALIQRELCPPTFSHPPLEKYIEHSLSRGENLTHGRLAQRLGGCHESWEKVFTDFCPQGSQLKSDLNSCYNLRNSLSHGGSASSTPLRTVMQYKNSVKSILDELKSKLPSISYS